MNLVIEQRPPTISSSKSQSESSPISNENDMNNSSSTPSSLVLKIKRHTTKQPKGTEPISSSSSMVEEEEEQETEDNHSRSTVSLQRSKRPNSNTATRRAASPAFNGKQQQTTKRSVTIDNNNNDLHSHIDDISATKRFKSNHCNSSSSSKVDASVETVSIGLATEPDHLGPCEPGTSVVLEGIVWNETDSGVLVVNVTWRGKTYVGTLLDSTKQDWACPRLTCESPTSDYDPRSSSCSSSSKTSRTKRTSAGGTNRSSHHQQSLSSFQQITSIILSSGMDDRKLRHNIKSRQSKRLNNLPSTITDELTTSLSPLTSPYRTNQTFFPPEISTSTSTSTSTTQSTSNLEPQLIPCSEFNCHKRFTSNIGLSYHLSNAHHKSDIVSQANTRDEEDVAHILANVAHYARRPSPPPPSVRCSPGQAVSSASTAQSPPSSRTSLQTSALTWPCPQISSKLVQSSSLNNNERMISPNSTRCQVNNADIYSASNILDNQTAPDQDDLQTSVKPTDHSIFRVQDESHSSSPSMNYPDSSWNTTKKDQHNNKKRPKLPTPPPTIPATSSSPAYSDISDEDPTTTGPISHEQMLPPSTINLLTATNEKLDENGNNVPSTSFLSSNGGVTHADIPNPAWTAQMLFQKFSPFISQPTLVQPPTPIASSSTKKKTRSTTPNGLNSKTHCPPTNGTSDSTVKNILDARRSSTIKPSSSPPINLYHYHPNGTGNDTKFSPSVINTLTSPNENLLHPSPTPTANTTGTLKPMDILDYSLSHNHSTCNGQYPHSSSLHPSR